MTNAISNFEVDSTLTWDGIHDAVETLELTQNVAELERSGITTIPPEKSAITPEFVDAVRAELLRLSGEITEREFSLESGPDTPISDLEPNNMFMIFQLLAYRIPEFEELILNPALQTLIGYLLGPDRCLSTCAGFIKWQCSRPPKGNRFEPIGMHVDSPTPDPVPMTPLVVANTNFLLTDVDDWDDGRRTRKPP